MGNLWWVFIAGVVLAVARRKRKGTAFWTGVILALISGFVLFTGSLDATSGLLASLAGILKDFFGNLKDIRINT